MPIDFKATADAILNSAYGTDGPGATAIIRRDGKTIWNGSRGYADVEAKKPIRTDTIFELGSIAKQFTARVILQLVDEGRLSLDDPLSKFFPDWPQPDEGDHPPASQSHVGYQGLQQDPGLDPQER